MSEMLTVLQAVCGYPNPQSPAEDFLAAAMFVYGNQKDPIPGITDQQLAEFVVSANENVARY